jgi:hypothetical protein
MSKAQNSELQDGIVLKPENWLLLSVALRQPRKRPLNHLLLSLVNCSKIEVS